MGAINRYPGAPFTNADNLVAQIFASAVIDALVKAAAMPARQPRNLPFASLGGLFVGRAKALEDLRQALQSAHAGSLAVRVVNGLGGVGKTRLAIEYAWAHEADYSALLFVRGDDAATLDAGLAALAGASVLDLPEREAREDPVKIEAALRWLDAHPTWLLILDNVDDEKAVAAVSQLMPRLKGGHVVITARASNFPASLQTLQLDVLDETSASHFLLERTRGKRVAAADDETRSQEIGHELGGLALGLEQAGAYIAKQRIPFARYLKLWSENREKALAWSDANLTGSEKTLATTWVTSVARLSPESRRLLDRLAMLAPDPIPDSLFEVPVPGEAAGHDAYEARAGLADYSLITQARGDGTGFVVHRLVQDFASRAMSDERRAEALREALDWVNAAFVGAPNDVRSWLVLDPLAPHGVAVAERADEAGITAPTGHLLNGLASLSQVKARYSEAELLYRRAVPAEESNFGPDHPEVAAVLNNLALLLRATNRPAEAEPLFRRALAIREKSLGPGHPQVASGLSNLAALLQQTNRPAEAKRLCRRALSIGEASYGPNHPDVAIALNNLAELLRETNRLSEAEPLYRRALAIYEASLGSDRPEVATCLNNLALLLQNTNRLAEAEPLFRRALAINEASFGPDHPEVASSLNNLANLLQNTNRLGEAEPLYRRAFAIDEASFGPDHPDVARDLSNLASLLHDTNRLAEAEPLIRRALAIDEASLGPDHPTVAIRLSNLAGLLYDTNRLAEAEPLIRRALAIFEKSLGTDHPNSVIARRHLALLLAQRRQAKPPEPAKKSLLSRLFGGR